MADETKAPQIENPEKITAKDLAEMVKQIRHNQRRCQRNPTPEKLATLESWERKVDAVVAVLTDTQMKFFDMDEMGAFSWQHANGIPPHAQTHRRKPHNPRCRRVSRRFRPFPRQAKEKPPGVPFLAVMPSLPIYLFRRPIDPPGIATYAVPGGSSF